MTCPMMMSLGVYVLGAAGTAERQRVHSHLAACPDCQAELLRLSPLPGLLARVPERMLTAGRPAPARQRRWRPRRAAVAAASVAGAAAGAAGWWLAAGLASLPPAGGPAATVTLTGANPVMHLRATAALTATSWGTRIQLRLQGEPRNVPCRLIIRSRSGRTEISGSWEAWQDGPITVPASVAWRPSDIASLQVAAAGRALVTISARQRPATAS